MQFLLFFNNILIHVQSFKCLNSLLHQQFADQIQFHEGPCKIGDAPFILYHHSGNAYYRKIGLGNTYYKKIHAYTSFFTSKLFLY